MLKDLHLYNFRAFQDFRISLGSGAYLVGPNNAGKSTILTALRVVDVLLKVAQRRNSSETRRVGDRILPTWPASLTDFPALRESVRYEFGDGEARIELRWKDGAQLVVVWPEETDEVEAPFFYLERKTGMPVRTAMQAREIFSPLGVIPVLTPIDHSENQLADQYVTRNIAGRLSSRHFRNQIRLLKLTGEWDNFLRFADPWMEGIRIESLDQHLEKDGIVLELYYTEPHSRVPKEIVWAGDGIQVWLQLLYHIYRVRNSQAIILDEPEVYLHPDLQRRLVHVLECTQKQIIVATHSSEIVAEADPSLVTIVDKTRKRSQRARDIATMEHLSRSLGTAFNLRLARALRSRVVLFVEGHDMTILRRLCKTLKLENLEIERGITVIKLEGFSRSDQVAPFAWLCDELLPEAIKTYIVLDRDYRTDEAITELENDFASVGINAHVWRRKELESYLLTPAVISRLSGLAEDATTTLLNDVTVEMENDIFSRLLDDRLRKEKSATKHAINVTSTFKKEFDEKWLVADFRLSHAPAKQVISRINEKLQGMGLKAISARSLATAHRSAEISSEMSDILREVNNAIEGEV